MLKRIFSLVLVALLVHIANAMPVVVAAQTGQEDRAVEKVKADVVKHAGKKDRVSVKLHDGSKLKGNISQVGADSFTLTDSKTRQSTVLAYSDVVQVKGAGGLSTIAKIGIGIGIGVGALALLFAIGKGTCDGFGC